MRAATGVHTPLALQCHGRLLTRSSLRLSGRGCNAGARPIYVTGDTVWWDGVAEVARRFAAGVVLLFAGAAQTRGPFNLTMNVNDAIETAHAFADAVIVPVRCDSWAHLTQDRSDLERSFTTPGVDCASSSQASRPLSSCRNSR